jgi:peptidylprolyl isomerase
MADVPAHIQRVQEEREQLNDRLTKLKAFIDTDKFKELGASDSYDLRRQVKPMEEYLAILDRRLNRALNPTSKPRFLVLNIATINDNEVEPVTIELHPDLAPNHVERITELASEGFYDGVPFHRVIPGFMAQGGDGGNKDGTGGSTKPDLKQEFSNEEHVRGTCSMARTNDPNSANSQFFICFEDARFLDRQYTVWGRVVEGMEVIDRLPKGEPPRSPGKIISTSLAD